MVTPNKKPPKKHFYEIPADINELTDAQIDAWAEQAYNQFMAQLKSEIVKEEVEDFYGVKKDKDNIH